MNDAILKILTQIRPEFDFSVSDDFVEQGLLDSYDIMMLVVDLEKQFLISIPGTDIVPENFRNVGTIAALLVKSGAKP